MTTTANARIWAGAIVQVAPTGTTAPVDVDTPLDAAFDDLGLIGEEGITLSSTSDNAEHYAYGGLHIRTTRNKFKKAIKVLALENNPAVYDLVNPGSTAATTASLTTRTVSTPTVNEKMFVFETSDGDVTRRIVIPRGEVTDIGDTVFIDSAMSAVELTIEAYASSAGVFYLELTDDPQAIVA
jgi:hypothetical protein